MSIIFKIVQGGENVKKQALITIITTMFIVIFAGTVSAADWTVNPGDNIQTTIDGAADDDTITVNDNAGTAHTYNQNIVINKRNLTLKANGTVTLQTPNPNNPTIDIHSTGSYSTVKGFIVTGSTNNANIYLQMGVTNCNIIENTINNAFYGISLSRDSSTTISHNTISTTTYGIYVLDSIGTTINDNIISSVTNGIYFRDYCTFNTISQNTVTASNYAIFFQEYCTNNNILNNVVIGAYGIYLDDFSDNNILDGNEVTNCLYDGITMGASTGNTIRNNLITNNQRYGFWSNYYGNTITGNTIINNVRGVGLNNYLANGQHETINYNRIANNSLWNLIYLQPTSHGTPDARYNWWGSNVQSQVAAKISGTVTYDPWLYMTINANPTTINNGVNSLITVSFNNYSFNGEAYTEFDPSVGHIPDGTPVTFSLTNGPFGTLPLPLTVNTLDGIASIMFTATGTGVQDVNGTTDNQKLMVNIPILGAHAVLDIFFADYDEFANNNYNIVPITDPVNYLDRVVVVSKITNMGPNRINWLQYLDSWSTHLTGTNDLWSSWDATTWGHLAYTPTGPHTENVALLDSGHTQYVVIGAIVNAANTIITDTITTTSQTPNDFEGFDTASANLVVNPASYVDVYKEFRNNPWGSVITTAKFHDVVYAMVRVQNAGPDSTSLTLLDTLTGISWTGNYYVLSGSINPSEPTNWVFNDAANPFDGTQWNILTLSSLIGGNVKWLAIEGIINQVGTVSNFAQAVGQSAYPYQGFDSYTSELYVPSADLYIIITSNKGSTVVGEQFTVKYKLGNRGPDDAEKVTVTIPLPEGFVISKIEGDGTWQIAGNKIIWTLDQVKVGDPYLYITGWTTRPGNYQFTASIASETFNINSTGVSSFSINSQTPVNAASNTVGMQETGTPLPGIVLAILMVLGGIITTRKNQ